MMFMKEISQCQSEVRRLIMAVEAARGAVEAVPVTWPLTKAWEELGCAAQAARKAKAKLEAKRD